MRTTHHIATMLAGLLSGLLSVGAVAAAELPFPVAEAKSTTVPREQFFDAVIEAVQQATVSSQTSGRIIEVNFDVDDYVPKDSVLVRFRDKEQRAALQAAKARFQEAKANFNRIKDLISRKLVSKADYDKAEAALKAARAGVAQAQERLEHTVVRAPYAGIVVERHVEPGETASPGQPLMTGLSLERLRVVSEVPENYIAQVRALAKARAILPTGAGKSVQGEKLTISPYADPRSHTFKVRVELPAGQHGFYPGSFAKVAFLIGEEHRLVIPVEAVVRRSEVTAAYVLKEDGRASFRQIRVGRALPGGSVEVLAGLSEGENVSLDPIRAGVYLKQQRAGEGS